jgi:ankyrin repeat protein
MIDVVVRAQIKANVYNDEGLSPLFYAVTSDHGHAVHTLIEQGADPNGAKDDAMTPVHGALLSRLPLLLLLLLFCVYVVDVFVFCVTDV